MTAPVYSLIAANQQLQDQLARRERSLQLPENPVHWTWLHGPTDRPDPRTGETSMSAAARVRRVGPIAAQFNSLN